MPRKRREVKMTTKASASVQPASRPWVEPYALWGLRWVFATLQGHVRAAHTLLPILTTVKPILATPLPPAFLCPPLKTGLSQHTQNFLSSLPHLQRNNQFTAEERGGRGQPFLNPLIKLFLQDPASWATLMVLRVRLQHELSQLQAPPHTGHSGW